MKRLLILFANGFPYNGSEPFLEKEYPLYGEYFDKVLISTACTRGERATRPLDEDLTEVLEDYTLSRDIRSVLSALPHFLTDTKYYAELFRLLRAGALTAGRFYEITVTALCGCHRAYAAKKWLKGHPEYDQIVLYSYWMTIPAYGALKLKKLLGRSDIRVVSRCHGYDVYSERSKPGYLPFQEDNVRHLSAVAPVSRNGAAYLKAKYDGLSNVECRYLGVARAQRRNPASARVPLRIVSCARVIPLKRLERIADALALMNRPVHWVHIGGGEGLSALLAHAKARLSGRDNVTFELLGSISNQQVYELYQTQPFHVFVNVSETEGVPVSIMEAMNVGIPVVATDVGGTAELVKDGESGYLLERDYEDTHLAALLEALSDMPQGEYAAMRQRAEQTIREGFDAETNFRRFIEEVLIDEVLM